jgi:hypothetical protein
MLKILVEGTDLTSSNDTRWTSTVAASSVANASQLRIAPVPPAPKLNGN